MHDRLIQFAAAVLVVLCIGAAGWLLPRAVSQSDAAELRYTDVSIEGAPPIVAIGAAVGALRGLIVDYLWIRLQIMREERQFYDAQRLADLITKLQPRFGEVWAFHGHNLAYNLSVLCGTADERWRLVNAGIDLIRNKGLRYNPNDLILYKELAWYFAHKIDGVADDAHLHYKRELAVEWQMLLGTPPEDPAQRVRWMQYIADAPDTYQQLVAKDPAVQKLVDDLNKALEELDPRAKVEVNRDLLQRISVLDAVRTSQYARMLHLRERRMERDPVFAAMDRVLADPANNKALVELVAFLRKQALVNDYNMDPQIMADYIREYGPLDFRHPQAHAFYWAKRGAEVGAKRYDNEEDIYRILNDDRVTLQAMYALSQSGRMAVDPFSKDIPGRMYDPRWISSLDKYFRHLYDKHYDTRGAGGDSFADAHQNFLSNAIRELYHAGEIAAAQEILDELDRLYGRTGQISNMQYAKPLDIFVQEITYNEYDRVPDHARNDVMAVLRRGLLEGYLLQRKNVLDQALQFAADLTTYFKNSRYTDFVTKMGDRRLGDLLNDLERSLEISLINLMRDTSIPLTDRLVIYNRLPDEQKAMCYDAAREQLASELAGTDLAANGFQIDHLMPEPVGIEAYRARQAELAKEREAQMDARQERGTQLTR